MSNDIYDPKFVADVFDRCSDTYRKWSNLASFGMVQRWRRQCVAALDLAHGAPASGVDLMAGTGEIWPHLLARFPNLSKVTAIDISPGMHKHALDTIHGGYQDRIVHLCQNMLTSDLPDASADFAVSTFGLKTFDAAQHNVFAAQLARVLKPGAPFSLIEAADPKGWVLRPVYRLHLDVVLPGIERLFMKGAQDFAMIGTYTKHFGKGETVTQALQAAGLETRTTYLMGGSAVLFSGRRPH